MEDPFPLVQRARIRRAARHGIEVEVGRRARRGGAAQPAVPDRAARPGGRSSPEGGDEPGRPHRRGAGRRTPLTSLPALRHAHCVRAQVDAVAVGSDTVLVDDPLLTVREVYRERPLTRVVFDRRLRVPPDGAAVLDARAAGPVIVLTSAQAVRDSGAARRRAASGRRHGARAPSATPGRSGSSCSARSACRAWCSKGGAALHARGLGRGRGGRGADLRGAGRRSAPTACRCSTAAASSSTALLERRVDLLGPDVLIEGYVHRPH